MQRQYDHKKIEKKWQGIWAKEKAGVAKFPSKQKKFYSLIEFPYPSGAGLHVGHIRSNTAMDIISRKRRMEGYNVLYPIGWDAFGLPTENFAIKTGKAPAKVTKENTDTFRRQLKSLGFSFDWSREINTTDPAYYKWTQWIFLQFFKKGLAYKAKTEINWCPKDKIGLANEEVVGGVCDRCGTKVEKREKEQWMLAITKYADRLDKDLDTVDYLPKIKIQQRNWIGKSEGAEIDFKINLPPTPSQKEGAKPLKFVILHGRNGTPENYNYPWLKKELERFGKVYLPALPHTEEPDDKEQADFVQKNIPLDENTIIVTHSFGGVVAMRLLERGIKVKSVILISTPISGKFLDHERKSISLAVNKGFNYSKIKKQADYFKILFDTSDNIVPREDAEALAKNLGIMPRYVKAKEPHFCGDEEPEIIKTVLEDLTSALPEWMKALPFGEGLGEVVTVFTTRPDTIFGATYLVLAPEHELINKIKSRIINWAEIGEYLKDAKKKTEIERTSEDKTKTGIEIKGVKAINPATNEEIPIWVADYVLPQYGTGAIMAVPAHDERDFAFAKKYNLEIRQVIAPLWYGERDDDRPRPELPYVERNAILAIVKHHKEDRYLVLDWKKVDWHTFITGGIEEGQTAEEAARREVLEETGYSNLKLIKELPPYHSRFYHTPKKVNRLGHFRCFLFELINDNREEVSREEAEIHSFRWLSKDEALKTLHVRAQRMALEQSFAPFALSEPGLLMNSGRFDGMESDKAKAAITEFVGGRMVTQYKLRDWVFSRQRYWGEPIPLIHCSKDGWVSVPDKDLPVKLPKVAKYKPTDTGESPLAGIKSFVNTRCPLCKGPAKRETDTMPNWAGSSWYFLRYTDPKNKKAFAGEKNLKYFMGNGVDWYNGGMEHTTLHLLYSRFWHKFLFDLGLVPTAEPYQKRTSHGMILAKGGEKMSKSRGNTVNPDDLVKTFGADTLRMYEMFMGPFDQAVVWNTDSLLGPRRFLERVWKMGVKLIGQKNFPNFALGDKRTGNRHVLKNSSGRTLLRLINKTIKKVSEDIEGMRFNTAISSLMICLNEMEKTGASIENFKIFLQLLYPFAPHISEELWQNLGGRKSIGSSGWPAWDPLLAQESEINIAVQINGKVRAEMLIGADWEEAAVKGKALGLEAVQRHLGGAEPKKVIYVKGRLINIVV